MLSIADLGWGSVIGNTLDHGVTYLPYGVDMPARSAGWRSCSPTARCCARGWARCRATSAWHLYKRGLGPTLDQLFMQSNFGIVTKMGVWLMPKPEVYMPMWLRVWSDDDLGPVIDTLRELMLDGTIRMVPQIMNTILLGSVLREPRPSGTTATARSPTQRSTQMARELEIGRWLHALRAVRRRGGGRPPLREDQARVRADPGRGGAGAPSTRPAEIAALEHPGERVQGGVPNLELNAHDRLVRRRGGRAHRLLAGRAADRPRRPRGPRPAARHGRGRRPGLHRRR